MSVRCVEHRENLNRRRRIKKSLIWLSRQFDRIMCSKRPGGLHFELQTRAYKPRKLGSVTLLSTSRSCMVDRSQDYLYITEAEVAQAIQKHSPGKAMPSYSSPAALWKAMCLSLARLVTKQPQDVFCPGVVVVPRSWCLSELVLLPRARQGPYITGTTTTHIASYPL